jgi:hypothetical protein
MGGEGFTNAYAIPDGVGAAAGLATRRMHELRGMSKGSPPLMRFFGAISKAEEGPTLAHDPRVLARALSTPRLQTTKTINQLPGPFAPSAQAEELLDPVPR